MGDGWWVNENTGYDYYNDDDEVFCCCWCCCEQFSCNYVVKAYFADPLEMCHFGHFNDEGIDLYSKCFNCKIDDVAKHTQK